MGLTFVKPKRPVWFLTSLAIAVVSIAAFVGLAWRAPWQPGRFWGLTFGTIAAVIFVFESLYPLRRRLMARPFGTAQHWLQLHVYGGALAALFVLVHMGFRWPGGQFGWWLLALTTITTLTGLGGVFLQKWIPAVLAGNLSVEALYDRIPEIAARLQGEADALAGGGSDALERFYFGSVRPSLAGVTPSWSYLVDVRSGRERRVAEFRNVAPFLGEAERARLDDLQAIALEKYELDAQYSLQRVLRYWIWLHLPPSMLLLGLVTAHILSVWVY